ncbi:MAG: succinate dehydrogenase/fumarate reductase cytochrome b subunit [Acidimicrobiales bacterium]|jgi:succinate dehydrogenase/fumarate reductase cytochrome b subunit
MIIESNPMKKQSITFSRTYTRLFLIGSLLLLLPFFTYAQGRTDIQTFLVDIPLFIKNLLLPFLFSLAFLYFLINMVRYFIIGGANEAEHEKAKRNALYGIAAFVFLISIWGIVGMFVQGPLEQTDTVCPDYICRGR